MRKHGKVIKLVNAALAVYNVGPIKRLAPGIKNNVTRCPIALCFYGAPTSGEVIVLNDKIGAKVAKVWGTKASSAVGETRLVELPKEIKSFILKFDAGKYPELEETDETK